MTNLEAGLWIAAMIALLCFVFWMKWQLSNWRLMRCPEAGSVTMVGVVRVPAEAGQAPSFAVQQCGLWPARKNCARGCLVRYGETASGYRVSLHALRPFERSRIPGPDHL